MCVCVCFRFSLMVVLCGSSNDSLSLRLDKSPDYQQCVICYQLMRRGGMFVHVEWTAFQPTILLQMAFKQSSLLLENSVNPRLSTRSKEIKGPTSTTRGLFSDRKQRTCIQNPQYDLQLPLDNTFQRTRCSLKWICRWCNAKGTHSFHFFFSTDMFTTLSKSHHIKLIRSRPPETFDERTKWTGPVRFIVEPNCSCGCFPDATPSQVWLYAQPSLTLCLRVCVSEYQVVCDGMILHGWRSLETHKIFHLFGKRHDLEECRKIMSESS